MGVVHRGFQDLNDMMTRAVDGNAPPQVRSAMLHGLMDEAQACEDEQLWDQIGHMVISAFRRNDLSAQVSDHFVRACPDRVFAKYAWQGPQRKFVYWAKRDRALRRQAS